MSAKSWKSDIFVVLVGTFILSLSALAQMPTATILGLVRDSSGVVVPGVSLAAKNAGTGLTRTTVSAADGSYRFLALPVGSYEIRAEHAGFQTDIRGGLTLNVGDEAVVNLTLQVGAVQQTVAVTADAPLVNTTSGELGGLVNEEKAGSHCMICMPWACSGGFTNPRHKQCAVATCLYVRTHRMSHITLDSSLQSLYYVKHGVRK